GNNIGIGFTGTTNIFQIYNNNSTRVNGTLTVTGAFSKGSGTFDIPHPDPAKQKRGYHLRHSFVESNTRGDNLYRYTITTDKCKAEIQLPNYFKYLNENPQVFVSAVGFIASCGGYVDDELETVRIIVSIDGAY